MNNSTIFSIWIVGTIVIWFVYSAFRGWNRDGILSDGDGPPVYILAIVWPFCLVVALSVGAMWVCAAIPYGCGRLTRRVLLERSAQAARTEVGRG